MSSILIGGIVMSLLIRKYLLKTDYDFDFWLHPISIYCYFSISMAERSKALRSGRSPVFWARVRIPLLTLVYCYFSDCIFCIRLLLKIFGDILKCNKADVAEWLRRLTRNPLSSGSVGWNPTICAAFGTSLVYRHAFLHYGARNPSTSKGCL